MLVLLGAQGAGGDDPGFPWGVAIIVVIALLVLVGGVLLARRGFERGTMASTPSEDQPEPEGVRAGNQPGVTADPERDGPAIGTRLRAEPHRARLSQRGPAGELAAPYVSHPEPIRRKPGPPQG